VENLMAMRSSTPPSWADLLRGRKKALALLAALEGGGGPLFTTPITAVELYRGAFLSANPIPIGFSQALQP